MSKKHPLYQTWRGMHARCLNPNRKDYKHYGGRGIKICPRWHKNNPNGFYNFIKDMGIKPPNTSIDRISNNADYSKNNCRWATPKQQSLNKTNTRFIFYENKKQCLSTVAEKRGISPNVIAARLSLEWSPERAVNTDLKITYNGSSLSMEQWGHKIGVKGNTLRKRIRTGWSLEKALTTPTMSKEESGRQKPLRREDSSSGTA